MNFINLTPHVVRLNNGTEIPPDGTVARIESSFVELNSSIKLFAVKKGKITGLPQPTHGTTFIVSTMVAEAASRVDVVSPATGHPDCVRKDGQVWSVPGFVVYF